jgi:hypothetical protein
VTYRRNTNDRPNVFSELSGNTVGSNLSVPITVAMRYGRSMHNFTFSYNRTSSTALSDLAFTNDVTGNLGVQGISDDPIDWGVPSLNFGSGLTSVRGVTPSVRKDQSYQVGYSWVRTVGRHNLRAGVTYEQDLNISRADSNPLGSYTFSGLYTGGALAGGQGGPLGFADFLLGLPQQASIATNDNGNGVSTPISIRGRTFSTSFQDDFRVGAKWTVNYGLQYNVMPPFVNTTGEMVNLDAAPGFTAVAPVFPGETGPWSGTYPAGLVRTDWNNVAPRLGAAWRVNNRTVMRFGYGLSYNTGSYAQIARNLYMQPPFFKTGTVTTTSIGGPITLADPFAGLADQPFTNTYGIDPNYQLGLIHQYDVDYSRDLFRTWSVGTTYIGTKGVDLDLLRAPNRGPAGELYPDVPSAFMWQSSDGASHMNGVSFRLQKRQSHGVAGTVTYTLAKSLDDTTATGGQATVAQDDQNLAAEWGPSNFDRRHQVNATGSLVLPWGRNRQWLADGGILAEIFGDWSMSATYTWQTGTPLTARCSTCAANLASGVSGTLRADSTGASISDAPAGYFFNPYAFSIPVPGTFGDSPRNIITGPSSHLLNAQFTRDISFTSTKVLSLNVNASNLLNTVNYASIDSNVNSSTFGKVLSVGSMRSIRVNARFRF